MILRLSETYEIDTETADNEELADACIALCRERDQLQASIDRRRETHAACGLVFSDDLIGITLIIVDREKASAWFEQALAECDDGQ